MAGIKKAISKKRVKLVLIGIMAAIFSTTVAIFIKYRALTTNPEKLIQAIPKGANLAIGRIKQTSTKNGKKEWSLDAESVHYITEKKEAVFQDLAIIFYLEDDEQVHLKADRGILQTEAHNFEVSGNVVVKNKHYLLETEKLHYSNINRILFTTVPVRITGGPYSVAANSMTFNLNTKQTLFEGQVRGIFNGSAVF
jgi:LPS export ABC transporter protein LptC